MLCNGLGLQTNVYVFIYIGDSDIVASQTDYSHSDQMGQNHQQYYILMVGEMVGSQLPLLGSTSDCFDRPTNERPENVVYKGYKFKNCVLLTVSYLYISNSRILTTVPHYPSHYKETSSENK